MPQENQRKRKAVVWCVRVGTRVGRELRSLMTYEARKISFGRRPANASFCQGKREPKEDALAG